MTKDWMKIGICVYIAGKIAYLIVQHTGIDKGQIQHDLIYTFFTGVFATKIVDFAYSVVKNGNKSAGK